MMPAKQAPYTVSLNALLNGLAVVDADIAVAAPSVDARKVASGGLFLAVPGQISHGLNFAQQAIERGASVIVYDPAFKGDALAKALAEKSSMKLIALPELNRHVSEIAARYFARPSANMSVVGITGTNGKTSVSHFLAQALTKTDGDCGVIGTLGWGLLHQLNETVNTTPDAVSVQQQLSLMLGDNIQSVAMEVSSHGLDQGRVNAVDFKGAVFTNLSHDHLDYHQTLEAYGQAKLALFKTPSLAFVVLNRDDAFSQTIIDALSPAVNALFFTRLATQQKSTFVISSEKQTAKGLSFDVAYDGQFAHIESPLFGSFNIDNLTATLATLVGMGWSFENAVLNVQRIQSVAGRMEKIALLPSCPSVVVDYAHTPDALVLALSSLREHCAGQLTVVFGCGGNRDEAKRAVMGRVALEGADSVVITNDNPRYESAQKIVEQITAGMNETDNVRVVLDREQAIQQAIATAAENDIVLVAGKGHEDYQQIGDERIPFSDVACVKASLKERVLVGGGETS